MTVNLPSALIALVSAERLGPQLPNPHDGLPSARVYQDVLAASLDRQRAFFARMVRRRWEVDKPPIRTVWELRLLVDFLLTDPEILFPKNRQGMALVRRLPWDVFHDMMTAVYPTNVAFPVQLCRLIGSVAQGRTMSGRLVDVAHELLRSVGFHVRTADVVREPSGHPDAWRRIVREAIWFDDWGCPVRLVFIDRRSHVVPLASGVLVAYDPRSSNPVRSDNAMEVHRVVDLHIAEPYTPSELARLEARGGRLL